MISREEFHIWDAFEASRVTTSQVKLLRYKTRAYRTQFERPPYRVDETREV